MGRSPGATKVDSVSGITLKDRRRHFVHSYASFPSSPEVKSFWPSKWPSPHVTFIYIQHHHHLTLLRRGFSYLLHNSKVGTKSDEKINGFIGAPSKVKKDCQLIVNVAREGLEHTGQLTEVTSGDVTLWKGNYFLSFFTSNALGSIYWLEIWF